MVKTGVAFGDFIIKDSTRRKHSDYGYDEGTLREIFLPLSLIVIFSFLFFKIFSLQVIHGSYYKNLSNTNRTKTVVVHAPRGVIFDRNGNSLVYNVPGFREEVNGKTVQLGRDEALSLIAKGTTNLEVDSLREYPYKEAAAHVIGYIGQISKDELGEPQFSSYLATDLVGKSGIEQEYESKLKGVDGKKLIEVDARGNDVRILGQTDPVPGQNITLSLDAGLQKAVYEAMSGVKKGAAIVSAPDGEVLAMVSKPSFDPNLFTLGPSYHVSSQSAYKNLTQVLMDGDNQPLLDRAIGGAYPPGSTFKLIVAASGLDNHLIDTNFQVDDTGVLKVGEFSFANWYYTGYGKTEGLVNVTTAIKRSNDIFFYKLAEKIGVDTISKTASLFGLGNPLGIDLAGEASGVVPTKEWKQKATGEPWYLGDTYHYGIGQGFLLTTPLQVNGWTQVVANQGNFFRPALLEIKNPKPEKTNLLTKDAATIIREGMIEACNPGGVAWPLFNYSVKNPKLKIDGRNITEVPQATSSADFKDYRHVVIACKTGTAETTTNQDPHSWITLFAPAYNPQVVVTVLSENSGEGSNVAGPIAKQILDYYFSK